MRYALGVKAKAMQSVSDIISTLGGPTKAGEALRLPPTTVSSWATRKSIPAKYWLGIIKASRGAVTAAQLVALSDEYEAPTTSRDGEAA